MLMPLVSDELELELLELVDGVVEVLVVVGMVDVATEYEMVMVLIL